MKKNYTIFLLFIALVACNQEKEPVNTLFTKLSPERTNIHFANNLIEDAENNHVLYDNFISGSGVAVGDLNNDGLPDLYFAANQENDRLYINQGDLIFEDITEKAGIAQDSTWSTGVTFADVNQDGYLDIYVCKYVHNQPEKSRNKLYINNGDLTFSEQARAYQLDDMGYSIQASFFDYDKDGDLDVYVVNQPPSGGGRKTISVSQNESRIYSDRLYRNKGKSNFGSYIFEDVTYISGIYNFAYGLGIAIGDLDNDGWSDIYVANDFDQPDFLFFNNQDGTFSNQMNRAAKHISNFSMGVDMADYNNDGRLDIMVLDMSAEDNKRIKTNMSGMEPKKFWEVVNRGGHYQYMYNTLQLNNGNGTFSEIGQLAGVHSTDWSWSPLFADFDNDGLKDLFVSNGIKRSMRNSDLEAKYVVHMDSLEEVAKATGKDLKEVFDVMDIVEMAPSEPLNNYIFQNKGDLTFEKKIEEWGLDHPSFSNGAAYADLDLDGDLELVINNVDEPASIYENHATQNNENKFIRFQLIPEKENLIYGTRVILKKQGENWQVAELTNARGYMSKSEDFLHFGVGNLNEIEEVRIQWSDGKENVLTHVSTNQTLRIEQAESQQLASIPKPKEYLFMPATNALDIDYRHVENDYDDYAKEVLLPHKMSNFGPSLAVGDVNRDGLEDFYVGGAAQSAGALYCQQSKGNFIAQSTSTWEKDRLYEDLGAVFFDVEGDGDMDLYVVSGGNAFPKNTDAYQDRLYLNDGKGNFTKANHLLPQFFTSGSCVTAGDFDQDGDTDLFVGGRVLPSTYPRSPQSHLLQNENGKFVEVTTELASGLQEIGMVTSATWTDFDQDQDLDLLVVGEWMPITLFENKDGKLENISESLGLEKSAGWYFKTVAKDMDNDGDEDWIIGNLGLNYKYKASESEPFEVFSSDFDNNGNLDIVLSYYNQGDQFPLRGRSCSSQQIPTLKKKFPTYDLFGSANLQEVYGEELTEAVNLKAYNFASLYVENLGNGQVKLHQLPMEAQFSSVNGILADDFNEDGHQDLLLCGNLYASEIETPRNDANIGLFLKGNGQGEFQPIHLMESGFFAPHDAKDITSLTLGKTKEKVILVANNNYKMQAIFHNPQVLREKKLASIP